MIGIDNMHKSTLTDVKTMFDIESNNIESK